MTWSIEKSTLKKLKKSMWDNNVKVIAGIRNREKSYFGFFFFIRKQSDILFIAYEKEYQS